LQESEEKGGMGKGGYVAEFVRTVWKPLMNEFISRKIKIVTNAGGMNPLALKEAIENATKEAGLPMPIVAAIVGDDLLPQAYEFREAEKFKVFDVCGEVEDLWPKDKMLISCNAYIGAIPIAEALKQGADIVITGRAVDSALVLGPLIYEFGWKETEYNLLSSGSLAGHIIECGCQATGGNFTDWKDSSENGWDNVGFPIVECFSDGSFIVTKPENTGGLVTPGTVGEQMLYEIGDPGAYILPDVICDWRNVEITELPKNDPSQKRSNRVLVKGAKGRPPTAFYKIGASSFDGFNMVVGLAIGGIDAVPKAQAVAEAILTKTRRLLKLGGFEDFAQSRIDILGSESIYGANSRRHDNREVIAKIAVHHYNPKALGIFALELAPAATGMAPGLFGGLGSGRPQPSPNIKYHSCLISRDLVPLKVIVGSKENLPRTYIPKEISNQTSPPEIPLPPAFNQTIYNGVTVPLIALVYGRSGDKGDTCNIGIMARKKEFYPLLKSTVTEKVVHNYFSHVVKGKVKRFELPGISGFNFILTQSLGGGGVSSLYSDRQGKSYAQQLLSLPITIPREWVPLLPSYWISKL